MKLVIRDFTVRMKGDQIIISKEEQSGMNIDLVSFNKTDVNHNDIMELLFNLVEEKYFEVDFEVDFDERGYLEFNILDKFEFYFNLLKKQSTCLHEGLVYKKD
jgi:hypothetical protein